MSKPIELIVTPRFKPDVGAQVELLRGLLARLRDANEKEGVSDQLACTTETPVRRHDQNGRTHC